MRKNHHGKKDRLVKRVFALCLALAVICTCLVPVFATEYKDVVDSGEEEIAGFGGDEAAYPDGNEAAGFGDDFPAVDDGEPREVYDDSETTSSSGSSSGNYTVEEKDDALVYVLNPDPSSSTGTDPVTQWSGEGDVVAKPDDKVVVSGDEIKKLQDMVVYRFWLKELNANDLQDITAQAQINNMTESEYLARNGEVLWNLYFIQAVPRAETIADYSSYIENPSSNRDPKGELRLFDYWYTLDEFGNRVRLNLTDPTSNILDDKTTTVNVYAAWKDGTVGSDEEKPVDHEDLVDKNPVPVDLTAKASTSYEDEDGNTKSATLPVEVKNLPSAADHLSVIHMGDDDMEAFYQKYSNDFGDMLPILGLKISPKNAKGETVQPAKGEKATVTVSGLEKLPEMEGATADTLKVFHETSDGNVEILDVLTYTNGTLTFETTSFSPFVVVRTDGYAVNTLDINNITDVSIKDDIANSGHYILNITVDGVEYEGADAGMFLHEHGYKVTWKQNGTVAKRKEISNGLYTLEKHGGWIDVIYTDGANKTYVVTVSNGTEEKSSSGKTVEYNKRLENGDFEQGGSNQTLEGTSGLVWKTTASDHLIELANINDGQSYKELQFDGRYWKVNDNINYGGIAFGATSTPNGSDQFAELNAGVEGALYQDVLTKPGLTMHWKFSHKARTRTNSGSGHNNQNRNVLMPGKKNADTMAMVIAPLELVEGITTQDQLEGLLAKCGNSSGTYTINGYDGHGDPKKAYQVYVVYDSSEIKGYSAWNTFDGWYGKYNYSTSSWNTRTDTYTVPEGQYLTRFFFVAVDSVFQSGNLRVGNLLDDVWFGQDAPPAPTDGSGRITVTKKFYGLTESEAKSVVSKGIISGDNGIGSITFSGDAWTSNSDIDGKYVAVSHTIDNLSLAANTPYQYTFTEDKEIAAVEGYTLKETLVDGKTKSVPSGTVYIDKENNLQSITFSNIYEKNTADVTLTKHVTGLMGDTHKDYTFSITGLDGKGVTLENGDLSNFTLTHNGSVTLKNVPMGTVFAVVETLGTESGYETKATGHDTFVTEASRTFYYKLVLKDGQQVLMACDADGSNEMEQDGLAITVTNHCTLKPDTGVLLDTLPYIVILAVVAGGGILLMLRKRHKEDD